MQKARFESLRSRRLWKRQHVGRVVTKARTQPSNAVKEGNALFELVVLEAGGAVLTGVSSKPLRRSTSGSFCWGAARVDVVCVREPDVSGREGALLRETEDLRATVSSSPAVYSSKSRRPVVSLKPPEKPPELPPE